MKEYMKAYLVDEGILLTKEDKEFDFYACVYDKKYGYYDDCQYYVKEMQVAIRDARKNVEKGAEKTYVIISSTLVSSDYDFENDDCVESESYSVDDVVYSIAKINGEIVENFLNI